MPVQPGANRPLTYTLVVANWGQTAVNLPITVTDWVPFGTTLRSIGQDGFTDDSTVVTWTRHVTLALGQTTSFSFSVDVSDVPSGTAIVNSDYRVAGAETGVAWGTPYTVTIVDPIFWLSKSVWPDPPGSNREMTYTLTLLNLGSMATGLVITDRVPAGVTYQRGGVETDGVVSWLWPSLDTGEVAEFTFTVSISDVMDIPIVNGDYAVCCAEGVCQAGQVLTSVVRGPTFQAFASLDPFVHQPGGGGSPVTPTLVVHNLGPGNALAARAILYFESIQVTSLADIEIIPNKGTLSMGPACGENCVAYTWIGDLAYRDVITFTTSETLFGNRGRNTRGSHPFTTTVVISDSLSNVSTDPVTATASGFATQYADLVVTKSAPPVIGRGQLLTYTLRVRNNALSTEGNPWLTDTVPLSTTLVEISHGGISQTLASATVISWTLPELGPAEETRRTFSVRVDDDLISGTQLLNADYRVTWVHGTTVFSATGEPVTTLVQDVGLIHSYKEVTPALALPGQNTVLTYSLHIVNSSAFSLTGVTLYDWLPWQSSTYQRDAVASAGQIVSDIVSIQWTGDVAPLSSEVVTLTVLVDPDFQGAITNTAVISHPDLLTGVVVEAVAYIGDKPVLRIAKSATPDELEEGDVLAYTLHVTNLGLRATGLVITDVLPLNTTYVPGSAAGNGVYKDGRMEWTIAALDFGKERAVSFQVIVASGTGVLSTEVLNAYYGVTCAEGVSAVGTPVRTILTTGGAATIYLPLVLRNY